MGEAVEIVRKAAVETGIFPLGGIRVRAVRCEHYAIADGNPDLGFLDMCSGSAKPRPRDPQEGRHAYLRGAVGLSRPVFAQRKFALSFDMQINDKGRAGSATTSTKL